MSVHWTTWSNLPLRWKGIAVVTVPVLPLIVLAGLVTSAADRQREAQTSVEHALTIKAEVATVFGLLSDAETGVRGYLLTRSPEGLRVVEQAALPLPSHFQRLASLIRDEEQRGRLQRIIELADRRPIGALLEYAKTTPADAPAPLVLLAQGRRVMADIRTEFAAMQHREDAILAQRVTVAKRAQDQLVTVAVAGVGLGLVAALVATLAFTHGLTTRIDGLRAEAARLAAGEPVVARRDARDEIGQLADALCDASALLQQRERELHQRVQEIDEARGELDQFFNVSLELLCIAGFDGRFRRVNPSWQKVLGWSPEQLAAVPFVEFVHTDDVAATNREAARLTDGDITVGFENRYRCSDGSYRWLSWKATGDPERGLIYAAARDVTVQKQLEQEQQQRVAELAALNAELEAFSYSVSHDLRAPLRHISGFAALLEQRASGRLDEQSTRYVATIKEAAGRMGRLIDDLLAFSRMGRAPVTTRDVDLQALVEDVKRELQGDATGRHVEWRIASLPHVVGDPALLRVALMNLMSNALKYTSTRSHAQIEVGANGHDEGETVVFVRDNGVGFDMQYVGKLFGVFQRLHRADDFDGTGIGLATVSRIIRRHGGRVWAEGATDRGATFYLALPAAGATTFQ
jgi:PAS domain S-box-containing protein